MKTAVFWVVAPCSLLEVYRCFRGAWCLYHQGGPIVLMMGRSAHCIPKEKVCRPNHTQSVNTYKVSKCK
jgi:hypothetical protein